MHSRFKVEPFCKADLDAANSNSFELANSIRQRKLPPRAASLIESLRDLGYSLETAIADIIDNSISANATKVDIWCAVDAEPLALAVVDDGHGMTEDELIAAMRPGSTSPTEARSAGDLGRFGLGLKTASFSQGRRLTVVSRKGGATSAAIWDLDALAEHDDWILSLPEPEDIESLPWLETLGDHGTMVLLEKLDRLAEETEGQARSDLLSGKLVVLQRHLSLVFHRFIEGDTVDRRKLKFRVNGIVVESFDPFCRGQTATQELPVERMSIDGETIEIRPYILPHHSKLSPQTWRYYKDRSEFLSNQGAYVYRNGRLMAWGDWFRMIPRGEATKLARVRIDFPSTLDALWTIDIKKSRAHPPPAVRARFKRIIERIAGRSVRVHQGRGERILQPGASPVWTRTVGRDGMISYAPDFDHPLLRAAIESAGPNSEAPVRTALLALGAAFPVDAIYADFADDPKRVTLARDNPDELRETIAGLKSVLDPDGDMEPRDFARLVLSTGLAGRSIEVIDAVSLELYAT
ncbi:ATP-binding protein [Hyphomonas oceanitis]|uniref:ATP-binding protein n=1 Tax=Hyphomonas oceanitis TaxID=81033 RepID=UPI000B2D4690|nr:ATP-binding protein [Hyphomonas oceanitis]